MSKERTELMKGTLCITISIPIEYYVKGIDELYDYDLNEDGTTTYNPHYEFDYEHGVEDDLGKYSDLNKHNRKHLEIIKMLEEKGYNIEEIAVE